MNGRRILIAVAAAIVAAAAVAAAEGSATHAGRVGFMHCRLAHLARRLDLTSEQQKQIQNIVAGELPRLRPWLQQLAEEKKQMLAATEAGQFDSAKVSAIAGQQAQTMAQLIVARQAIEAKVYAVLTPEQRIKFDQMRQRRLQRLQSWLASPEMLPSQ
jgi:Spy/CpxP family protein refolding chaperone